jgi:glucan endo-1,3-alpha-glucosidase
METGWAYLKSELNKIAPVCIPRFRHPLIPTKAYSPPQIFFIPAFFISPARYPNISAMDGAFNVDSSTGVSMLNCLI